MAPAINKIRNEYAKKISIEELANLCGVSSCYFCRIFKQVTGVTALQYIIAYRLKVADAMLSNSDVSITEIANECGFEDVSYFCRCYKKFYHQLPGKKRQDFFKLQKAKSNLRE